MRTKNLTLLAQVIGRQDNCQNSSILVKSKASGFAILIDFDLLQL